MHQQLGLYTRAIKAAPVVCEGDLDAPVKLLQAVEGYQYTLPDGQGRQALAFSHYDLASNKLSPEVRASF